MKKHGDKIVQNLIKIANMKTNFTGTSVEECIQVIPTVLIKAKLTSQSKHTKHCCEL